MVHIWFSAKWTVSAPQMLVNNLTSRRDTDCFQKTDRNHESQGSQAFSCNCAMKISACSIYFSMSK